MFYAYVKTAHPMQATKFMNGAFVAPPLGKEMVALLAAEVLVRPVEASNVVHDGVLLSAVQEVRLAAQ